MIHREGGGLALLSLICVIGVLFFSSPGTNDVNYWEEWSNNAGKLGISAGYKANRDAYPPLSSVILVMASKVSLPLGISPFTGFKLSLFLFLLATSLCFFIWTRNLPLTALMQLALTLNSMALSYIDICVAPALLLALWSLQRRRLLLTTLSFAVACLMKWQPIIIAPFVAAHIARTAKPKDIAARVILPSLLVFIALITFFGFEVVDTLARAMTDPDPFLSGDALNLTWVITHLLHVIHPDSFSPLVEGVAKRIETRDMRILLAPKLIFLLSYATIFGFFIRRSRAFEDLLAFSLMGFLAYFILNTGVHENHLFIPSLLAILLYALTKRHLATAVGVAIAANVNLFLFYGIDGRGLPFSRVVGVDLALVFSILYVLLFPMICYELLTRAWRIPEASI